MILISYFRSTKVTSTFVIFYASPSSSFYFKSMVSRSKRRKIMKQIRRKYSQVTLKFKFMLKHSIVNVRINLTIPIIKK